MEAIHATMLSDEAGISRATFYRAYPSVEAVLDAYYERFAERVTGRLLMFLNRNERGSGWLSEVVDAVVEDAASARHVLVAMFREELRPGSAARRARQQRIDAQVRMIAEWWQRMTETPADEDIIRAFALLLQVVGLHVALHPELEAHHREDIKRACSFIINSTIDAYRVTQS